MLAEELACLVFVNVHEKADVFVPDVDPERHDKSGLGAGGGDLWGERWVEGFEGGG
ncbi:MAG: hypothetical protein RI897_4208 [Verrucomicrobiota bacterium]